MNIVVIGARGVGKSTLAQHLARSLHRPLLSTDVLIRYEHAGASIAEIISAHEGDWRPFRDMEYQVVRKVAAMRDVVIDCGGGIVVDLDEQGMEQFSPRKVTLLRRCGQVLWLRGDPARITERIQHDPDRPVLDQRMAPDQIMLRRTPFYAQAAHHILDVEGKSCRALLREARRMLAPSQQSGNS